MPILIENRQKNTEISLSGLRKEIDSLLRLVGKEDAELSVIFVDDKEITDINRRYLGRTEPTNVISFSMSEGEWGDVNPHLLGDIVISVDTAHRDALQGGLSFDDEITYLLIHGILHLLGYDHTKSNNDIKIMEQKEKEVFFALKGYELD
jgi:probable rRNA maturation factor